MRMAVDSERGGRTTTSVLPAFSREGRLSPMMTLRCTRNLLSRLGVILAPPETLPTTALGDWYAELLVARPNWLVLCISEKTLLSVVVAARPLATLVARFQAAVDARLLSLGVSQDQRENEMA